VTDRLIRITTALAVATVAAVAAIISYRHAYELVSTHGETGATARLLPFTVDGLILAASMLILDANRRHRPVPPLARWCLGAGILATVGANLAHGLGNGPIGALVSAWPALALAGSFELLMTLIRTESRASTTPVPSVQVDQPLSITCDDVPSALTGAPSAEQTIQAWYRAGHSQRAIARHSPRTQHRPPQGQAHHRSSRVGTESVGGGMPKKFRRCRRSRCEPSMRTLGGEVVRGRWGRLLTGGGRRELLEGYEVAVLRCCTAPGPTVRSRGLSLRFSG
jgi:Protein of unknown function (DUF2637)